MNDCYLPGLFSPSALFTPGEDLPGNVLSGPAFDFYSETGGFFVKEFPGIGKQRLAGLEGGKIVRQPRLLTEWP